MEFGEELGLRDWGLGVRVSVGSLGGGFFFRGLEQLGGNLRS